MWFRMKLKFRPFEIWYCSLVYKSVDWFFKPCIIFELLYLIILRLGFNYYVCINRKGQKKYQRQLFIQKSLDKLSSNLILPCLLMTSYMFESSAFDEGKPTTFYEAFVHPIQWGLVHGALKRNKYISMWMWATTINHLHTSSIFIMTYCLHSFILLTDTF